MDFFKVKKFRKARKPTLDQDNEGKSIPPHEEPDSENGVDDFSKSVSTDNAADAEDEDDDDFITNEVKRRLKELRRNSFLVLIPEEDSCPEDDEEEGEEGETSSSEWRDVEAEGRQWWGGFDAFYEKYCERMLIFDRLSAQQLGEAVPQVPLTPSPRTASKKLTSPLRCLSLKKIEEPDEEMEKLQQSEGNPYDDLETAYLAQTCLTWEALHCQYTQLCQKISGQPENMTCYSRSAQQFQQFHVLLQRFIENEPFEPGLRPEIYARARKSLPKLLQVPNIQGSEQKAAEEAGSDILVLAPDLLRIMENTILTFHLFLKTDNRKSTGVLNLFANQNHCASPQQQKAVKLKELRRKKKGWKKKSWPQTDDDVQLLFALIDAKLCSMVLRRERIVKGHFFWCEEKMKKLDLSDGKLHRDPSPILFPC
ncbi:uncharacterized protein LOC104423274 isoform X2 [Eucalyptus grandis]|uniref:uncharacterized protein LOC104423274 isoform X2 n=1 Tax=Eucalyptus grandis TaxID=71139 RepID=UPI00192EE951|nr:uncharacterized protein LOC104423274 isoform X2 [Eucalyptus grandis]